ncbi:MAG: hemolysin family protein [Planctomycetales bacterium]
MSIETLKPILFPLMWVILWLVSWACYSLRDFSRSRLEEISRLRGHEGRFGEILRNHESTLLGLELLKVGLWVLLVAGIFPYWQTDWVSGPRGEWSPVHVIGDTLLFLFLSMCLGVIVPWMLSRVACETYLDFIWPVIRVLTGLLSPLILAARWFDRIVHRIAGLEEPEKGDAAVITEEIRTVMEEGSREGVLEDEARSMIHRVMDLPEVDVADVMTPRTAMTTLSAEATLEEARELFVRVGHSRVPLLGQGADDIVGMLYAKDMLKYLDPRAPQTVKLIDCARKPFYVPETMGIDKLLEALKRERVHVAVVLDEYGGVAGLVTMEDILEEIVGEIADEHDESEADPFREVRPQVFEVDAGQHIDDVNERLETTIPSDQEIDTLGGFVFSQMGRIPLEGEQVQWENILFTVLHADKRRIKRLRLEIQSSEAVEAEAPIEE